MHVSSKREPGSGLKGGSERQQSSYSLETECFSVELLRTSVSFSSLEVIAGEQYEPPDIPSGPAEARAQSKGPLVQVSNARTTMSLVSDEELARSDLERLKTAAVLHANSETRLVHGVLGIHEGPRVAKFWVFARAQRRPAKDN